MVRIGIINVTGYMGAETARLLHAHPEVQVTCVTGRSAAGKPLGEVFPHLAPLDLTIESELDEDRVDAVVSALPHAASAEALLPYIERGLPVIDLSADFRLRRLADYEAWYGTHPAPHLLEQAVFGLPELHRDEVARAKLVAGPGCHATAAILALAPVCKAGLIEPDVIVDSKTGISGAGRTLNLTYHFAEANEGVSAYALGGHRQVPEMTQELGALSVACEDAGVPDRDQVHLRTQEAPVPRITFVPHLVPMTRGILVTCYAALRAETDEARLRALYRDYYGDSPFVRLASAPPSTKQTLGTNACLLYPTVDAQHGRLIVVACLDNLMKGGAGQGVQCLNLMLGLPETAGLEGLALYP